MKYIILSLLLLACNNTPASELQELKGMEVFVVPDKTCVVKLSEVLVTATTDALINYVAADSCDNMQEPGVEFTSENCTKTKNKHGEYRVACHPIPKEEPPPISDVEFDKLMDDSDDLIERLQDKIDRGCYLKCPDEE